MNEKCGRHQVFVEIHLEPPVDENRREFMIPERVWRDVDAVGGLYTAAKVLEIVNVPAGSHRLLQRLRAEG